MKIQKHFFITKKEKDAIATILNLLKDDFDCNTCPYHIFEKGSCNCCDKSDLYGLLTQISDRSIVIE